VSENLQKGYSDVFANMLNLFPGNNVFEKFKNILKIWENDVSFTLNFNFNEKPTKVQLSYVISQLELGETETEVKTDNIFAVLGIPKKFTNSEEPLPIYDILQYMEISGVQLNIGELDPDVKKPIIDSLPANVFNLLLNSIINMGESTVRFDNPVMKDMKLNFLTCEPYMFLKGMFSKYDEIYFRDIIFHLSKRIDGYLLMQSTPLELEYYVERYSKEVEQQNTSLSI
jgi:hypothetical protein